MHHSRRWGGGEDLHVELQGETSKWLEQRAADRATNLHLSAPPPHTFAHWWGHHRGPVCLHLLWQKRLSNSPRDGREADRQSWAATVLKYLLKPSAEPPIMSLHRSKPLCKTHLGPLNDFCTLGSFPDSHFIQLKSRSAPTPLKHG